MICFKCNGEEFATQAAVISQNFRGELLDVNTPVCVCQACGWQTLGRGQSDELRKRTADAYRQKHGLLTSAEIVDRRTRLGMSQREFAAFLRVGEASVKRWEAWQVQDASSDELIRIKSDFLAQLHQQALFALQQSLFACHFSMTVRVKSSPSKEFSPAQFLYERRGLKKEFSLLDCQQFTPGGYSGRKCFTEETEIDYDSNSNLAASA
jgi:putative zinc finger/helix-turn-helix YgiT family protein